MKRVAISQSNYVPWRGYFELIASVDVFVLLDDAQYTRRDWRNRNRIKTPQGAKWLTIPVDVKGKYTQSIQDTRIADPDWATAHWTTIRQIYARAEGFAEAGPFVEDLYATAPAGALSDVNHHFLSRICRRLSITTPITWSRDLDPQGTRTDRLVDIARKLDADVYVSGPAAQAYLDEKDFGRHGIRVEWHDYGPLPHYPQPHPPFDPRLSVLDLLLNTGDAARDFLTTKSFP